MKLNSNPQIELVTWEDITTANETWSDSNSLEAWYSDEADGKVAQMGFIIFEDRNNLLISSAYMESLDYHGQVDKIPKGVIKSRQRLLIEEEVLEILNKLTGGQYKSFKQAYDKAESGDEG